MEIAPNPHNRRFRMTREDMPPTRKRRGPTNPRLLWLGILGGPVAFTLVRVAGIVLLSSNCGHSSGTASLLMAVITVLGALIAGGAGLLSWRIWRETGHKEDEQTRGDIAFVPFAALGGMFLSGVFGIAAVLDGGLALGLGSVCFQ